MTEVGSNKCINDVNISSSDALVPSGNRQALLGPLLTNIHDAIPRHNTTIVHPLHPYTLYDDQTDDSRKTLM